jgi:hypothetical protein
VRVNATPAGTEAPAEKKKRKQRRAYAQRNLDNEFSSLAVVEPVGAAQDPAAQSPPVPDVAMEPPTVDQEGKTEDDDPDEHQRRFAAAYAGGQRAAETLQAAVSNPSDLDREAARKTCKAERERVRRANMTASQKERTKTKNRERARAARVARVHMADEERDVAREADRLRQRQHRERGT